MINITLTSDTVLNQIITDDHVFEKIQTDVIELEIETLYSEEVFTPSRLRTKLSGMINRSDHATRFYHEQARRSRA